MLTIQPYEPAKHYDQLLECLQELIESKSSYPPKNITTGEQSSAEEWLAGDEEGEEAHRYVAILEGKVVGHVGITTLHDYMVKYMQEHAFVQNETERKGYVEIGTFFVSPHAQKHGVGGRLFSHILTEISRLKKVPALAVVESHDSHKATKLYERHGMINVGHFHGTHGKNMIFIKKY